MTWDDLQRLLIALLIWFLNVPSGVPIEATGTTTQPLSTRPMASLQPSPTPERTRLPKVADPGGSWHNDPEVSWYGPGFYGKRTACGLALTKTLLGVAHRNLPCGTLVEFSWEGRTAIVPVVDRGPYVTGRTWDLTGGLCVYLRHCFTGRIEWRIVHAP